MTHVPVNGSWSCTAILKPLYSTGAPGLTLTCLEVADVVVCAKLQNASSLRFLGVVDVIVDGTGCCAGESLGESREGSERFVLLLTVTMSGRARWL